MAVVTFTRGATEVELPVYEASSEKIPQPGTVAGVTGGGTVIAQDIGPDVVMWRLYFVGLSLAQKTSLYDFFLTTVRRAYYTFTFTDKDEITTYTVRWWNEWTIKPNPKAPWTVWEGVILLRVEPA